MNVAWAAATTYCEWAGRKLPSEAQWEKAARGPNGNTFPWGNNAPSKDLANSDNGIGGSTSKVGQYPNGKSFYGAYDMAGNVFEWVNDWYGEKYYASSPSTNPPGPDSGHWRVVRGGAWGNADYFVRSDARNYINPDFQVPNIGFRCVLVQ
jgi:formylglycine-generating enzyme required for sulfatase activity